MARPNLNKSTPESASAVGDATAQNAKWPSAGQFWRQLGIVAVVVVAWAALFAGYMAVAGNSLTASDSLAHNGPGRARNVLTEATDTPAAAVQAVSAPTVTVPAPAVSAPTVVVSAPASNVPSFAREVEPIFQARCVRCHAGALSTYDQVAQNVLPGDSANTTIVQVMQNGSMPRGGPRMTAAQIATISQWIDAGAPNN
jgi:hypothetical protein